MEISVSLTDPSGNIIIYDSVTHEHVLSDHPDIADDAIEAASDTITAPDYIYGSRYHKYRDAYFKIGAFKKVPYCYCVSIVEFNKPGRGNVVLTVHAALTPEAISIDTANLKYIKPSL